MSEDNLEALDGDLDGEPPRKKWSGKKIVILAAAALLILGGGGAAVMMLTGGEDHPKAEGEEHAEEAEHGEGPAKAEKIETIFIDLPDMVVNLNTGGRQPRYLRAKISLEVDRQSARKAVEAQLPRVLDDFQVYLREMRLEDLNGSAGLYRLKEELLRRLNTTLAPVEVKDVLFREMLVQ